MKRKFAVTVIGTLCVMLVLSVVSVTAQQAPAPANTEQALFKQLVEKTQSRPARGSTQAESLRNINTHLSEIIALCDAYIEKYPKGSNLTAVKGHYVRAKYFTAHFAKDHAGKEKVVTEILALIAERPEAPEVLGLHGIMFQHYIGVNQPDKAVVHVRRFAEMTPDKAAAPNAWIMVYRIESQREKNAEAMSALKTVLSKYPQSPEAAFAKAALEGLKRIGKPLKLKFTALSGKKIDLADYRGKVVLVDFWATWCKPCLTEIPGMIKLYDEKKKEGFEIIGISFDKDKQEMLDYAKKAGMTWPQYFDGKGWDNKLGKTFGIKSIPATFLVDRKGVLRAVGLRGKQLAERVDGLLKEPKNR